MNGSIISACKLNPISKCFTLVFILGIIFSQFSVAQISGPLRKSTVNPRYFADATGNIVYLTGSHTWSNLQDNGNGNPPPRFDYNGYLEFLTAHNHNFFRLWSWEETRWTAETKDTAYWFSPNQYTRTGPGLALDGLPKYNLDQFNQTYFDSLRQRVIQAGNRGMYVSVMLFNGWSGQSQFVNANNGNAGLDPYRGHPYNVNNNINGVNGDPGNLGDGQRLYTLDNPAVTSRQLAYMRRVIDAVNDLDNVLYEICNEASSYSTAWQYLMIDSIKAYESTKPKQHPVGMTAQWPDFVGNNNANSVMYASPADWISPNWYNHSENMPPADGSKVVILDTDHIWGVGGNRMWVWETFTRGMNPIFMDGYDGKSYGCGGVNFDSSDANWISIRKNLGFTRAYAERMNLEAMIPRGDLVSNPNYCLANTSPTEGEYLVYLKWGANTSVNLTGGPSEVSIEWFNPETGVTIPSGTIEGGTEQFFVAPFSGDAVLYLKATGAEPLPSGTFQSNLSTLPYGGGQVTLSWSSNFATSASINQGIGSVQVNGSVNVNVTTTTTFALTLTNSAGSTQLTTTVNVAPPPQSPSSAIYSDNALTTPWNDIRSWSVTRNYAFTGTVFQGTSSARFVHSPWASLQFSQGTWGAFTQIDPTPYQSLDFVIRGASSAFTIKVSCVSPSGSNIQTPVNVTVPANTWQTVSIPMTQLAAVPFISIQFTAAGSNVTFYMDNISLVLQPTGPTVPAVPNLISPANNSIDQPTALTLRWNSSNGAATYHLQVAADSIFTSLILNDSTLTDTLRNLSGLNNFTNYFWRIRAKNTGGTSAYSSPWKFTTIISLPGIPTLISPLNNATGLFSPVTFMWNRSQSASVYGLQIALDSLFSNIVLNDSTLTDTLRIVSSLQFGTTYFWRANAKNIGGSSGFSSGRTFTTAIAPPATPVLAYPSDNLTNQSINPVITWHRTPTAESYRVQLALDSLFANIVTDQSGVIDTSLQISSLINLTQYYWRVNAANSGGSSPYSLFRKFTTIAPPPGVPQLASPVNNSINQLFPQVVRWSDVPLASNYHLQVSVDSLFNLVVYNDSSVVDTVFTLNDLQPSTKYFWRVRAKNIGGNSEFSIPWTFTTVIAQPGVPILASPLNNSFNQQISTLLNWYRVANAESYLLQMSADSMFSTVFVDIHGTDTSMVISDLDYSAQYFWRVMAENAGGGSLFSDSYRFTTIDPVPQVPQLLAPGNQSANLPLTVYFNWTTSLYASTYRFQISSDSQFSAIIYDDSTLTDTSITVSSLSYASQYFWRVRAENPDTTSNFSQTWSFTTGSLPSVPILSSPVNNTVDVPILNSLQWQAASNALQYHLQVSPDSLFSTMLVNDSLLTDTLAILDSLDYYSQYFWRVRALNTLGSSSFSPLWRFTTVAPPLPTVYYIYQENSLNAPWNDIRSWSITRNYASTNPVYAGSTSGRFVHSPWAALQFSQGTWGAFVNINPSPFQSLDFAVHGGTTGVTLFVSCIRPTGGNIFTPVTFTVPANTWQVKSIPMSQLANVPFLSVYFTAKSSNVTFSLDDVGLRYNQGFVPASVDVAFERVYADVSHDGKVDGRDIAVFTALMKKNDLSKADIGPAEGTTPKLLLKGDAIIDSKDFEAFAELWKWEHNNLVDSKNFAVGIGDNNIVSSSINVARRTDIKTSKKQRFKIQLPELNEAHTLQLSLRYNPAAITVENIIVTDTKEERLHLKNIDNTAGYSVAAVTSAASMVQHEHLAAGIFEIEVMKQSTLLTDSLEIQIQAFSDTSESVVYFKKKISLNELLIPKQYGLEQNYPNPFNPATTIRYLLPEKSRVSIEVFNALGQSVVKLVDKEIDAGIEEVFWRANTSSGMYFYRLHATSVENPKKSFVETKKMILLK